MNCYITRCNILIQTLNLGGGNHTPLGIRCHKKELGSLNVKNRFSWPKRASCNDYSAVRNKLKCHLRLPVNAFFYNTTECLYRALPKTSLHESALCYILSHNIRSVQF